MASRPRSSGKSSPSFFAPALKSMVAIFREGRGQRVRVAMIEAERVAMHRVGNFEAVVGELGGIHRPQLRAHVTAA